MIRERTSPPTSHLIQNSQVLFVAIYPNFEICSPTLLMAEPGF